MKVTTKRDTIKQGVANYIVNYRNVRAGYTDFPRVVEQLRLLDSSTCSADEVDNIIGNTSWTTLRCEECEQSVNAVVEIGTQESYDGPTSVCLSCLKAAVQSLEGL